MSTTLEKPVEAAATSTGEALSNVELLSSLPLKTCDQPCIESQMMSMTYLVNLDTNFEDRNGYVTGISKFMEEATVHAELNELLEEGKGFASTLYTWRSCSRAAPSIKADQENRIEIYEKLVEVLEPEIAKLVNLMKFQKRAVTRFCDEVKKLTHQAKKNDFVSESYLLTLGKLLNMFAVLDALKNMKASIRNDNAQYKRAKQSIKKMSDTTSLDESHSLTMFLAQHDEITNSLKKTLETLPGYEDLMADIINICSYHYEEKMYLLPSEKHMLLKVMGFCLFLIDGSTANIYKMETKKKLNLSKIDKFFKFLPVVPLYGDMQIVLFSYIQNGSNFEDNKSRWSCGSSTIGSQYNIAEHLPRISTEHTGVISDLITCRSKLRVTTKMMSEISINQKTQLYDLALRGLKLLGSWTSLVMELFSWKLVHPVTDTLCPDKEAEEYERATRYNYTSEEKFALVEVLAMIKGLQRLMFSMENILTKAIHSTIYSEVQEYAQVTLREPLRTATKKKKTIVLSILKAIRDTSADWLEGSEPQNDPALKGEKDPKTGYKIERKDRNVGTSSTQLYMTRTMSESLIADRSLGGKKTMRKEIDGATLDAVSTFHKRSFFYGHLSHLSECLRECGDLSQFWYREFFLEMTMGRRIQFPIEMSMPWILTDTILQSKDPAMMEYVFYPLDLYNDSAQYALTYFKKQFLYDEVEAEVNLCFDQFVYKLSEQIFAYYKQQAGCMLLNKGFQQECQKLLANFPQFSNLLNVPGQHQLSNRYESLMKQRNVQLLGRSVDFNKLITQRIQGSIQRSLDLAISKFESSDITFIIELEALLDVNRLCHKLLNVHLMLPNFDVMLQEANHTVQAPYGRITLRIFWELNYEFLPQYCYNGATNRFVKASQSALILSGGQKPKETRDKASSAKSHYLFGSKILNNAFAKMLHVFSNFIGQPHFQAMVHLLEYGGIAVIIKELLKTTKTLIQGELLQYTKPLMEAMPKLCGMPMMDYGVKGVFSFYEAKLHPIIQYTDMRTEVFQRFRVLGNTILFCQQLELNLTQEELRGLLLAGPFRKIFPRVYLKEGEKSETVTRKMEKDYDCMNVLPIIDKYGTQQQLKTIKEGAVLTKERLCVGLSMFEVVLRQIATFLDDPVWDGRNTPPANGVMNVEECTEFHRLWSAIQFLMCWTVGKNEITVEECFGEGLTWAGCTLIVLLHQHFRFEEFDFCNHLVNVHDFVKKPVTEFSGMDIKRFLKRIERFQLLNKQIFAVINRYLHGSGQESKFIPLTKVKHLDVPEVCM
ncbi:cytoplasmic FMR1-interacting protein 2-like [Ptychodera flava]|uniref:cytoplasmic FMR1-interacting protein 2-like n=1 Tax=Ptychodera flava TaxID=63121 RepID=UPI00396A6313